MYSPQAKHGVYIFKWSKKRIICDRDHKRHGKAEMFIIWPFIEKSVLASELKQRFSHDGNSTKRLDQMQEQGFVNYSGGYAKLRWMNGQRPELGGKASGSWQAHQMAARVSQIEELKTRVVTHGHTRAEKVGPGAVAKLTLWYIPFPLGARELKTLWETKEEVTGILSHVKLTDLRTWLLVLSLPWHGLPLVTQMVKNLPAMQESRVRSPDWDDSPEKERAIHSSILAWKISWTEEPGRLQSTGSQRVGHDWAINTTLTYW